MMSRTVRHCKYFRQRGPRTVAGLLILLAIFVSGGSLSAADTAPESAVDESAVDESASSPRSQPAVDFLRDVKPILAARCYACHGPDQGEGGLRLHQQDSALAELDSGAVAIVPGAPDESELLARVSSDDEFMRMPPEGEPLKAEQIEILRRWIAEGAAWQEHWAFQAPQRYPVPEVKNKDWVRTPIDAFILAKLEANQLQPAPPADKVSLVRRLYFDLTGLPPTPEQVEAFVRDEREDAYERLVDELLDSPHYGERWARLWLDLVRFAETNSFERDGLKPHAWRYRDYVIRSFNEDKPYDQFLREQLAGDELEEVTADSIIATGYYRLGIWDDEPADPLQARYDGLDDIVATTGKVMLGLTIDCARCHDHKIDPIPQTDYYSMLAFFQGIAPMQTRGSNIERPIFRSDEQRREYERAVRDLQQRRDEVQTQLTAIEEQFRQQVTRVLSQDVQQADLNDVEYRFYRNTWERLPRFDELKPETVGKLEKPYFDIRLASREEAFGFVFAGALIVPQDGQYTFTLDSDDGARLTIDGEVVLDYDGLHELGQPQTASVALKAGRVPIRLDYFQGKHDKGLELTWSGPGFEKRYLSATTAQGEVVADLAAKPLPELLKQFGPELLGTERMKQYESLQTRLEELKRERVPAEYALCVTEVGSEAPETFVLQRGNPHVPGEKVEPAFPTILGGGTAEVQPPPTGASSGRRRALANWIASPNNIMTARVMVNRIWQGHFGRGIVRSANNFGELGDPPTHPELLDWLATEFVRLDWRIKPMHKLILMSNAYRMSCEAHPDGLARDPANDLFWRFNMRRLSAEEVRDAILAINGQLNTQMFGPGFYSRISQEVLAGQSNPGAGWGESPPEQRARRSIYIHVKRSLMTPLLVSFDFPEPDSSCPERFTTTQPAQALTMLNGEFAHEQAAHFAERLRQEAGEDPEAQVRRALRLAMCRVDEKEVRRGLELLESLQSEHQVDRETALKYYCLLVLNLNEFMYLN